MGPDDSLDSYSNGNTRLVCAFCTPDAIFFDNHTACAFCTAVALASLDTGKPSEEIILDMLEINPIAMCILAVRGEEIFRLEEEDAFQRFYAGECAYAARWGYPTPTREDARSLYDLLQQQAQAAFATC